MTHNPHALRTSLKFQLARVRRSRALCSAASFRASNKDADDISRWVDLDDEEALEQQIYDPMEDADDDAPLLLTDIGGVDPDEVMYAIEEISDKYLSDLESDLIWLMRQGRRPVEISRILKIPECEVVRMRRNCFRKIRTVYLYDYHHDKQAFLTRVSEICLFSPKQARVLTMFFSYYGLRQIAETIGSRPSNVHRSLEMMRKKIDAALPNDDPMRFFLGAFKDFKYLCLTLRTR